MNWRQTVNQIVSCDVIIASSLHAIVVAEAYGIPTIWVQPTTRIKGGQHKFLDYFEGTCRDVRLRQWQPDRIRSLVRFATSPPKLELDGLIEAAKKVREQ